MERWAPDMLERIVAEDDFHVSPFREDGVTYGTPVWIWSVAADGLLYIRAYNGQSSSWYKAAVSQGAGRIHAAGATYDVAFSVAPLEARDAVDQAFTAKYAKSSYLPLQLADRPAGATLLVWPLDRESGR